MKSSKTAKAIKALVSSLGRPPSPDEVVGTLTSASDPAPMPEEEKSVQLNLRVPAAVKQRVRMLAARDGITNSEVVTRALEMYDGNTGMAGHQ
jgi:hypothetical protein